MVKDTSQAAFELLPLLDEVQREMAGDVDWAAILEQARKGVRSTHLGVFVEPYLSYVLDGTKTVESRFSVNRCPPWNCVRSGDVLLLKASGGPVLGACTVDRVWSYHLDESKFASLRKEFAQSLRAQDPAFWQQRAGAAYATLMRIQNVKPFTGFPCAKRDRRGWVVLAPRDEQLLI